ncbi:MAG: YlzJ-like family protein [Oscillospiraceae bacterium]|nr:YlzJ-like family protein [Oscillospiraceae bacterium]
MLHTKESLDLVFPEDIADVKYIQVECGVIEAEKTADGYSVRRLISTKPSDYLKQQYTPGVQIK